MSTGDPTDFQQSLRTDRARSITADVIARRTRGEALTDEEIVRQHPDLMAELFVELNAARQIRVTTRAAASADPVASRLAILPAEQLEEAIELPSNDEWPHTEEIEERPRIDGFQLLTEIGRGGQGRVYRAIHEATGRHVAIKVITGGALIDSKNRARFDREVHTLAMLNHPHIVSIVDRGRSTEGAFFLAMEYVDGLSAEDFALECAAHDAEHPKILLSTLAKVAKAIHAAHEGGIIHRDIKPSNIRIDRHGEPRVLDFGLAQSIEPSDRAITTTGQWIGSLPWFCPEQASGDVPQADAQTDVYALGVVAFQLLTGTFPYDTTGSVKNVLKRIESSSPPRPSSIAHTTFAFPRRVDAVILKALAKSRSQRYADAMAFGLDLEAVGVGQRPKALREGKRRTAILTGCVTVLTLVLGLVVWVALRATPPEVVDLPHRENRIGMQFVQLPAGTFLMGSPRREAGRLVDESEHTVTLTRPYWMGKTEVTWAQYSTVMTSPVPKGAKPEMPATGIAWQDAMQFCDRLSKMDGNAYRLPTEAEWEYACRAQSSRVPRDLTDLAWYGPNSQNAPHAVATKRPNNWGLYDMLGNVAEWCVDGYADYPRSENSFDPLGPAPDSVHYPLCRGGNFTSTGVNCRPSSRQAIESGIHSFAGLRVVLLPTSATVSNIK